MQRIFERTLAFLTILVMSRPVYAGGPGNVFGEIIVWSIGLAIAVAPISAICLGLMFRKNIFLWLSRVILATIVYLLVATPMMSSFFIFTPAFGVFGMMYWSVSILINNRQRASQSGKYIPTRLAEQDSHYDDSLDIGRKPSRVGIWIAISYTFWAPASLFNLRVLFGLPLALIPPFDSCYIDFIPLVFPPVVVAIVLTTCIMVITHRQYPNIKAQRSALAFNTILLFSFMVSAEVYSSILMSESLQKHQAERFRSQSFTKSLIHAQDRGGDTHAEFTEHGQHYCWSYRIRDFYQCGP